MSQRINQAPIDRFTSAHAGFGILFASAALPWWAALGISVVFEWFENDLKDAYPAAFPYSSHDSRWNTIGDTAALMAAYLLARRALRDGPGSRGRAAIHAASGAAVGGLTGAVGAGLGGGGGEIGAQAASWGERGYRVGAAATGAAAVENPGARALAALGGLLAGPLGAALGAYLGTPDTAQ